jgi:hypothetical protein
MARRILRYTKPDGINGWYLDYSDGILKPRATTPHGGIRKETCSMSDRFTLLLSYIAVAAASGLVFTLITLLLQRI